MTRGVAKNFTDPDSYNFITVLQAWKSPRFYLGKQNDWFEFHK